MKSHKKMTQLKLYLPTKPSSINQGFGVNAAYYARFLDAAGNPFQGHNGIDFQAAHGTPLFAVCDGQAMYNKDAHGGDGIILNTEAAYEYKGELVDFNIVYWHMCPANDPQFPIKIPCDGNWHQVKCGDILGYSDNTGAPYESSGDHLHFGLVPLDPQWNALEPLNGEGGCIDPTPYFNGVCIQDYIAGKLVDSAADIANEIVASNEIEVSQKIGLLQTIMGAINKIISLFS